MSGVLVVVLVGIVVAVVLLIGAAWLVGSTLPVGHIASSSACYQQRREAIWDALVRVEEQVEWRPGLEKVRRLSQRGDRPAWQETSRFGTVEVHVVESVPQKRLVAEIVPEERSFGGSWTYELSDCEGGTRLTITENGEIYNPFFRFVSRYVTGYHQTQEAFLQALGERFGEDVSPRREIEVEDAARTPAEG